MKPDLKAIAERAAAATEGPWRVADYTSEENPNTYWIGGPDFVEDGGYSLLNKADAEFIANARNDIPELLDYIADLEAVVEAAREFDKFSRKVEESKQLLGQSEYVISKNLRSDLRQALSKLDGDQS